MLNKRQEKIIMLLDDLKDWITGKEISRLMDVSGRTIRSDIEAINRFYEMRLIESDLRKGYRINQKAFVNLQVEPGEVIPQTPRERCAYIIRRMLFEKKEINLLDLEYQVFISGYSIDNDIKRIKKILEPYDGLKLVRSKNFIKLVGGEENKRRLYKDLLSQETQGNFLNMNNLAGMFKDFDLVKVKADFENIMEKYNYHIREMAMPMLMIHIGVAIERILHHNYIEASQAAASLGEHKEYMIAEEFFELLSRKYHTEIVENEVKLLALQLLGKRAADIREEGRQRQKGEIDEAGLTEAVIKTVKDDFDIDLSEDSDLRNGLTVHLRGLIERRDRNIRISNIYLQDLKRKYPLIFELAIHVGKMLDEYLDMNISENEIGFLALHLGAAYERRHASKKYRAVMIYPIDRALSNMCLTKVENLFSDRLDIVECLSFFEEKTVLALNPDLILTTLQIKHNLDIPTIQISLFINNEDESRIFRTLNSIEKERFNEKFKIKLRELIEEKTFHYGIDLKTPEEVINYMCGHLEKLGYCDEEFRRSVLQREKMAATSFVYSFAVPHSLGVPSKRPSISVAFLKNPIRWGEFEVKMVMLLAVNKEQQEMLKMFFAWLSAMINDANHFAELLETEGYEDFMSKITG